MGIRLLVRSFAARRKRLRNAAEQPVPRLLNLAARPTYSTSRQVNVEAI
jgi:hypothetical protein